MSLSTAVSGKEIHEQYWSLIEPEAKPLFIPMVVQEPEGKEANSFLQLSKSKGHKVATDIMNFMAVNGNAVTKPFEGDPPSIEFHKKYWGKAESKKFIRKMVNSVEPSPLFTAIQKGYRVAAMCLIAMGAKYPKEKNEDGNTALHLAAMDPLMNKVIVQLMDLSEEIDPVNKEKQTPLHLAAGTHSDDRVVFQFIQHSAKVDAEDGKESNPIHYAYYSKLPKNVVVLDAYSN